MKSIKSFSILVIMSVIPYIGFANQHPQAHFGIYGIQHFNSLTDYQKHYVGQVVIYLPNCMGFQSHYDDEFLDAGGKFSSVYTLSKITGNDKRMTFILSEENGKTKVKIDVYNQEIYNSSGKYTYCITDSYTIPLLLLGKFNQDKSNYIGKTFGNSITNLEVTDVVIQRVRWEDDKSYEAYPKLVFEITDKSDGKKTYVDIINTQNLNELGMTFTNPSFKCNYTVVGISTITLHRNIPTKMYIVKNNMSGIRKEVEANSAKTDAFKGDDSGKFIATLSKVEKPSNAAVRYGNTTTITDKDITKFSYVDNFIDIIIFASTDQFHFILKNVSDNTIKIVWNEAVFVDVDGNTSKVMHTGINYSQREGDQPASTIIKGAKLEDLAAPTVNVYYSDVLKEWTSDSLYKNADKKAEGQTIRLMLPIQVKDVINEYIFEFGLTYVYDNPEYLAG